MSKHPLPKPARPALLSLLALLLAGCASTSSNSSNFAAATSYTVASGNWAIAPQPAAGNSAPVPAASGSLLRAADGTLTGTFRLSPAPACLPPATNLAVTGSVDAKGQLHLASEPINGATWTLTGQLAADGRSLTASTTSLSGGACAPVTASAAGTLYTPISGTYAGSFTDASGVTVPVSTTLTQTSAPDANGQYHLSGSATFPSNPCFASPAVTDSLVTGNSLSASYSPQQGPVSSLVTSTVSASGTFNADATTLTITAYSVAGGDCDGDTGTGLLSKQ
jgi:hypothetical protein